MYMLTEWSMDTYGLSELLTTLWQPYKEPSAERAGGHFFYHCDITPDVYFDLAVDDRGDCVLFSLWRYDARGNSGHIYFNGKSVEFSAFEDDGPLTQEEYREFGEKWIDIFRRTVWLCAIPIEHSAHEELEWSLWWRENAGVMA